MICLKESCPVTGEHTCCFGCAEKDDCPNACLYAPEACEYADNGETALADFAEQHMAAFQALRELVIAKKEAEAREKELKDQLKAAMEEHGIKGIDNELLRIVYIPETIGTSIDTAMIKRKYPSVAAECVKETTKSSYIKIEVKDGGRKAV